MSMVRALILAAVSLPASSPGQAPKWEQVWDQPDKAIIYVDRASITGSGDMRTMSTRTVYKGDLPEGYIAERIRTEEFDCERHQSRLRHVKILAADGRAPQEVDVSPADSKWVPDEPDSLGAAKIKVACGISGDWLSSG
jgi:hypothetical protein